MDKYVDIDSNIFNKKYFPLLNENRRYQLIYGGAGTGKSYFVAQRLIYEMMTNPGRNWLVVRKIGRTIKQSVYAQIISVIADWKVGGLFECKINHIVCKNGSEAIFIGVDEPDKIRSITCKNGTINAIWAEEATELTKDDFTQLDLRLRGVSKLHKLFILTFNPKVKSGTHWLKDGFFKGQPQDDFCLVKTTIEDNINHIDSGYIKVLQGLTGVFRTVYYLGEWATMTGDIYAWREATEVPTRYVRVFYGLDFGYTNNETALVRVYENLDGSYLIEELVYEKKLSNQAIIKYLAENNVSSGDEIYADSAEPKSIDEIYNAGYNIHPAEKGKDSVIFGIQYLQSKEITIIGPNLVDEAGSYSWKKDKEGVSVNEPVKFKDHLLDAARYAITSSVGRSEYMGENIKNKLNALKPITTGYMGRKF